MVFMPGEDVKEILDALKNDVKMEKVSSINTSAEFSFDQDGFLVGEGVANFVREDGVVFKIKWTHSVRDGLKHVWVGVFDPDKTVPPVK